MRDKLLYLLLPLGVAIVVIIIMVTFLDVKYKQINKEIDENLGETTGWVTDYGISGKTVAKRVCFKYEVNGQEFEGAFGLNGEQKHFERQCEEQGKSSIVGATFKVEYSILNPEKSRVIVGEFVYNKNYKF